MQSFRSQYGRKGVRVSDYCPTRAITWKMGQTHVGTPARDVEQLVRDALESKYAKRDPRWTPAREAEAVRFALWQHAENGAEYQHAMGARA